MTNTTLAAVLAAAACCAAMTSPALGAVTAAEAAALKTQLTPSGAERAGNKDGSIPAWDGGYTTPLPGYVPGGKRPDPFAAEKPLFTITAANLAQYADKLSEGSKLMFKRFPEYRMEVYATRRSFVAPGYIYERTAKNAVATSVKDSDNGPLPDNYQGGYPFPIPKSGTEAMLNHVLRWTGDGTANVQRLYLVTAEGKAVMQAENKVEADYPPNMPTGFDPKQWDGTTRRGRVLTLAPNVSKGSASVILSNLDTERTRVWLYLTGQRRLRMLPNPCCDSIAPNTSGVQNFDELQIFDGTLKRYDWKLVGKKELYVPYNTNRTLIPREADLVKGKYIEPQSMRWELHRVWVVEAALKPGARHVFPKATFYLDEDSWSALLGDRYDALGQLAKSSWMLPMVAPDFPMLMTFSFGTHDHLTGAWTLQSVVNDQPSQFARKTDFPSNHFSPEAVEGEGVR